MTAQAALDVITQLLAARDREQIVELAREAAALAAEIERLTEPGSGSARTGDHVAAALLSQTAARIAEELVADLDRRDDRAKRMIAIDAAAAETRRIAEQLGALISAPLG